MLDLNIFYNNVKLIHSKEEIDNFNTIYVNNYIKAKTFEDLIDKFPKNLHPIIAHEFKKQYELKIGIQGGVLVELTILATVAKLFNIENFKFENSKYTYENDKYSFVLQGNSGHGGITEGNDLIITDKINNKKYNCEIKEPFARLNEKDFLYDEEGHLCKTSRTSDEEFKKFLPIIQAYNNTTSVFQHIGHNFPLGTELVSEIIDNYFDNVDYLFTYVDNYLLVLPKDKSLFSKIYTNNGSEIRGTNGKNLKNVFTPVYAKKVLSKYLICEDNQYYYFNAQSFTCVNSRESAGHRYKFKEGFAIKGDVTIKDNILKCKKNQFKQNSPLVSPKIKLISNYNDIKTIVLQGDNN